MTMTQVPVRHFKVLENPQIAEPNSIYFIFGPNNVGLLVSDSEGNTHPVVVDQAVLTNLVNQAAAMKLPINREVNAQIGTAYTLQASDNGKIITFSNAAPTFVKLPAGLGSGFNCELMQLGVGQVTIVPQGTVINHRQGHNKIAGRFSRATLGAYASNFFVLAGETRKVNLLLDMISVVPNRAYSFRKLRDSYLGNCAKVRPGGSSGAWTDIGFDANDKFDETAALAVGSNLECFFYDQSGNGNHEQPGNSVPHLSFNLLNGRVVRNFTNAHVVFGNLSAFTAGECHRLFKFNTDEINFGGARYWWDIGSNNETTFFPYYTGDIDDEFGTTARKHINNPSIPTNVWRLYSVYSAANDWQAFFDSHSIFSTTTNTVGFSSNASIFNNATMWDAEFILFSQKLSTFDRRTLWDNTQDYYGLTF